jgi:hypothetical protein
MVPDSEPVWVALIVVFGIIVTLVIAALTGRPLRIGLGRFAVVFGTRRSPPGSTASPTPALPLRSNPAAERRRGDQKGQQSK